MGSSWSGRRDLNPRVPEPHLRVYLGTYADVSFRQQFTSVPTCPHMRENARIRRALDASLAYSADEVCRFRRYGSNRWRARAIAVLVQHWSSLASVCWASLNGLRQPRTQGLTLNQLSIRTGSTR